MKKFLCICLLGLLAITSKSQSVGVGTTTPHTSAALDISSTSKGLLIPRMTTAQRDSIATPLAGLQILNLDDYCLDIYDGTNWIKNCGVKIIGTDTVAPLWSPKSAFGGGVRTDAVAFSIGTKGYMGTGFDGSYKKDFWEYDPATNVWSQKADFAGTVRRSAFGFTIGGFGYIGTGFNGSFLSDMYMYTPGSNSWSVRASIPGFFGRTEAFCFSTGSTAIAGTGQNSMGVLDDVYQYVPGSNSWSAVPDFPIPSYSLTAFVANGIGYVGIGWMDDEPWPFGMGSAPNNKLYKLQGSWIEVATMPGNGRYNATGIGLGTKGYVSTGKEFTAIYHDDSWSYDAVANTWTQLADIGGPGRASACGFAVEGKVYLGTGNNSGTNFSDFYELDLFPIGMEYSAPDLPGPIVSLKENLWTKDNATLYSNYTGTPGIAITDAGKVGIGIIAPNASLQFANLIQNRKIVLYEDANNDHQYYGLGINASTLRYQVDNTASSHVFYAATGASSSSELMRIRGNGTVGIGTSSPAASAALDVSSTTKGVLIPRMTTAQRTAIATPATGLLVFDITTNSFWLRGTSAWAELMDNLDMEVFRNGPDKIYMALTDSVGIGTNNPAYKLDVKTAPNNYGISHTDGVRQIATWLGEGGEIGTVSNHSFRLFANNGLKQFTLLPNGNIGINIPSDPTNRLDIAHGAARTGTHATGRPLYVTGTLSDASNGVEIRDADGTQGVGIGRNTVYAAGSLTDQNIGLAGKGTLGAVLMTTNGAERVRVSGAGNVGIGNTAPHAPLHFANAIANRKIVLYEQADNNHQYYGFGVNSNILRYQVDGTVSDHVFYAGIDVSTSSELLRIKGNGNVGIGNTTPNAPLQFSNATQNRKIVLNEIANNNHQYSGFGMNTSILRYQVAETTSDHVFYAGAGTTTSNELMRIKGNGIVGVGTATPEASAALDVSSTTKGVLIPRMTTAQRTAIATPATGLLVFDITTNSFWFRGTSAWIELIDNLDTEVFRNGPDKIYMALTDSVGIGTNNPAYKLDVKTATNNYGISHTDGVKQIATWVGDGGEIGTVSNHSFRLFANNGLKQFTLLPNGNIGINIPSDPANRFDIAHGAARSGSHATGRPLYVTGTLSDAANGVEIRDADGTQGVGIGRNTVYAAGSLADQNIGLAGKGTLGAVLMTTNGAERVRVSGAGHVGIGNTAPHAPLHFANSTANRKIVLFEQADNNHQFYGFGVNGNILRYQVDGTISDHVFYAAVNATTSNELARINGDGNLSIAGSIITEAFIEPTLLNGFTNYGADHATAAYYKDKSGRVFLKGLVNNVSNPTGLVVFTLPVGYRPSTTGRLVFTTLSNGSIARVDITAAGNVTVFSGTVGWVSLDNISFRAD